jgi:transcriptional regulator with XRE-family HTH domain
MAILAEDVFGKTMTPKQRTKAARRGEELLAEHLTMQQLRKARELTQAQLAKILGKDQVQISQIEKRTDVLLSTLRRYVEAMGGNLSLVVQFEDREPVFLAGLAEEGPVPVPRPSHGKRQK